MSKKNGWETPCKFCGKPVYETPSRRKAERGKFCSKICSANSRRGKPGPRFKPEQHSFISVCNRGNGQYKQVIRRMSRDPNTFSLWRPEHVLIAEKTLGRKLKKGEVVHHINMDSLDNRNSNLLICNNKYHMWLHFQYARRFAELCLGGQRNAGEFS